MKKRIWKIVHCVTEILGILLLLWSAYPILRFSELPSKIPTHFNFLGEVDAWGDRTNIIVLPIIALLIYAGLTILQRFPQSFNYPITITEENRKKAYSYSINTVRYIKLSTILVFSYLSNRIYIIATSNARPEFNSLFLVLILLMCIAIFIAALISLFRLRKHVDEF